MRQHKSKKNTKYKYTIKTYKNRELQNRQQENTTAINTDSTINTVHDMRSDQLRALAVCSIATPSHCKRNMSITSLTHYHFDVV